MQGFFRVRFLISVVMILYLFHIASPQSVLAYSETDERPVFLNWPLPSYIGVARISQFPNTPWTWNYLGLNPGQQCPPAFGYLLNAEFWNVWKDNSVPEKQDMARADPNNFEMVNCYSTLGLAGENGHEATDTKAPAETPVYASADGKVAGWRLLDLNTMLVLKHCIDGQWDVAGNCNGGRKWYTTYMHIVPDDDILQMEKDIPEGTQVGLIYAQGDNSHLHFEVGVDQRSYFNYVNPWGRDEPPWTGCMWKDQSLCVQSNPGYERIGVITPSGRFFVRDDNLMLAEIFEVDGLKDFRMVGKRIAILDQDGYLFVKDIEFKQVLPFSYGAVRNWSDLGNDIVNYQITQNRIAILGSDDLLKVKDGDLHNNWVVQADNVAAFSISDHRIGVLTPLGELMVKDGSLDTDWTQIAVNVKTFQLLDGRIAVVDLYGNLFIQEGSLNSEWKLMAGNVKAFQLSGKRVAILNKAGEFLVNDGNLRAELMLQAEGVQYFQLAGDRILIFDEGGKWKIKNGDLYQPWEDMNGLAIKDIKLNGGLPVFVE